MGRWPAVGEPGADWALAVWAPAWLATRSTRPPVLELDPEGKVLRTWGGPGEGYTWYDQEHGIYIDHNGFVWTGTSNGFHVMKFTQDGEHVMTIGEPGVNKESDDPDHLGRPANFYVEPKTNEIFIADGYRNKRVVVYDAATGKYLRHWGAYGKPPDDDYKYEYPVKVDDPPPQFSTVHGIAGTKDGLIYVADRRGSRIQVFRQNGEYLMERFVRPETGRSGTGFSLQLSRDPEQSLLYLMDGTNQRVWILRRKDLKILDRFGKPGRQAGEFIRAHMISIDSKNRMYTGEAGNGRRIQRWILKGTKPAASVEPPSPSPRPPRREGGGHRRVQRFNFFSVLGGCEPLQFLEPIEGHDEFGPVGASALLDHQEALAVGGDVVSASHPTFADGRHDFVRTEASSCG